MKNALHELISRNAPCYVYDYETLADSARLLQKTFPAYDFLFSVKANPFPPVVKALASMGIGADAASLGEVQLARSCDMRNIYFSAAGKPDKAIENAMGQCHLIADSMGEMERMAAIAARRGLTLPVGIRVNPAFSMGGGPGGSSKFGIDEELLPMLAERLREWQQIRVTGLHVHVKSQNLDAHVLGAYYRNCYELAKRVKATLGCDMEYINFGGGIGVVYDGTRETSLDFDVLRTYTDAIATDNEKTLGARLLIESGRFLTCRMGTYYLKAVDVKESRGTKYVIVENGMNGLQKPAIAAMLRAACSAGELMPQEPMFTSEHAFGFTVLSDAAETETVNIVGNLCCAQDILVNHFTGPKIRVGDLIAVSNAGAYACTLTAQRFSSHPAPQEFLMDAKGTVME